VNYKNARNVMKKQCKLYMLSATASNLYTMLELNRLNYSVNCNAGIPAEKKLQRRNNENGMVGWKPGTSTSVNGMVGWNQYFSNF
jgi:hypothetical protein